MELATAPTPRAAKRVPTDADRKAELIELLRNEYLGEAERMALGTELFHLNVSLKAKE